MTDRTESPSSVRVRDLVSAYERQTSDANPLEESYVRPRAKSIGNALTYKNFRQANLEFHNMVDIEKELVKIEAHLNYYEVYEKETHVAFQEQLFNVLTSIVSIDPEDQESAVQLKRKLIGETQKLATLLNSRLPFDGNHSYKGIRKTYSTIVRREEAVVSTSVKNHQEHRAILSSTTNSGWNGGYMSEESLNSTKESVDLSSRIDDSSSIDLNNVEEIPQANTPPPQKKIIDNEQSGIIPSVSKLRQFFSFRRETKPEVKVTSASYSGITRSQSLNIKSNRQSVVKRNRNEEIKKKEESISEKDEVIENIQNEEVPITSSGQDLSISQSIDNSTNIDSSESNIYVESTKDIQDYKEVETEVTHKVSVSKLKSLFEKNQSETNEGLGLLTTKQTEFSSDFNLPFTAMNLGVYRLKRTISGNYMNFTGLLKNVDVNRKADLSKSKSLSDLKITNFSYGAKDAEVDANDLSKEIDDNDDYEHVSFDAGKESKEVNNNVVKNETVEKTGKEVKESLLKVPIELQVVEGDTKEKSKEEVSTSETDQTIHQESETIVLSKSVESLRQTYESLSSGAGQPSGESNQEIRHVFHKTVIEPVQTSASIVVEPALKIPVQLRTGYSNVSSSKEVQETSSNSTNSKESNDDIKQILHRTIEPISSTIDGSDEPKLKIPIQLRTGFANVSHSQEVTENIHKTNIIATEKKEITVQEQKEPQLKIPIQLKVGVNRTEGKIFSADQTTQDSGETLASAGTVDILTQRFEHNMGYTTSTDVNEDIKHILHRTVGPIPTSTTDGSEEPLLKVPIQLRTGFTNVSQSQDVKENTLKTNIIATEKKEITVQEQKEPELKIPIQLKVGVNTTEGKIFSASQTTQDSGETMASAGTVDTLTQRFEHNMGYTTSIDVNEDIKHILHRTVGPIPSSTIDGSQEPLLKVPIQLRTGFANVSQSQDVKENTKETNTITTEKKGITVQEQKEPELKIPIQVRVGAAKAEENTHETNTITTEKKEITVQEQKEPELKIPIQLRVGVNKAEETTQKTTAKEQKITVQEQKQPQLKIPVQLRVGVNKIEEKTIATDQTTQDSGETLSSAGTVEILTQQFEHNTGFTSSTDVSEDIKHILHRTVGPIPTSNTDGSEEPLLKVPIQFRGGIANISHSQETSGQITTTTETLGSKNIESNQEHIEPLLKVPIQLKVGSTNSEEHISRTTETVVSANKESSQQSEPLLKIPIQLRVGSGYSEEHITESTETTIKENTETSNEHKEPSPKVPVQLAVGTGNTQQYQKAAEDTSMAKSSESILTEIIEHASTSGGTIEEIKPNVEKTVVKVPLDFESEEHSDFEIIEHSSEHKTEESKKNEILEEKITQEPLLKVPIQLRVSNNVSSTDSFTNSGDIRITADINAQEKVPMVYVTQTSSGQDETLVSKQGTMDRAKIEEKTESFMKILDTPEFSSLLSNSSLSQSSSQSSSLSSSQSSGQISSSASKVSVSYSEKRTVQQTSTTQVSHKIVSSSSSSLSSSQSSQNYLQVLQEPISYTLLQSSEIPSEKSTVTITEVEGGTEERKRRKINLNVSQENLFEEMLDGADSLENVDEEFEKMLEETPE